MRRCLLPWRTKQHSSMLSVLVATSSFAPRSSASLFASRQQPLAVSMQADELAMVQAMSDSFWKGKRARLQAELAQQLAELDEFEARERALQQTASTAIGGGGGGGASVAALQAELAAERERSAALEAKLAQSLLDAELNMQKVSAYWCAALAPPRPARSCISLMPATAALLLSGSRS